MEKGIYSESIIKRLKTLEKEVQYLESEIVNSKEIGNQTVKQINWMFSCIQYGSKLSDSDLQNLVSAFIKSVTCYSNGNVEVCLNLYNHPTPDSHFLGIKVQKSINEYLAYKRKGTVREESPSLHQNKALPELIDSDESLVRDLSILSKYDFFFEDNELIVRTILPRKQKRK